jgi:hypothetical protein
VDISPRVWQVTILAMFSLGRNISVTSENKERRMTVDNLFAGNITKLVK